MPNLGAGVDNHVNLTFTPTVVFVPTPGQSTVARLYNEGRTLIYIGGAEVSQYTGLPLPPGGKPVEIFNPPGNLYAVSYGQIGVAAGTTATATLPTNLMAPGLSSIPTTTTGAVTGLVPGNIIAIGNTVNSSNIEFVTVATSAATTVITATLQYPHIGGEVLYPVVATYGQLRVTSGVL